MKTKVATKKTASNGKLNPWPREERLVPPWLYRQIKLQRAADAGQVAEAVATLARLRSEIDALEKALPQVWAVERTRLVAVEMRKLRDEAELRAFVCGRLEMLALDSPASCALLGTPEAHVLSPETMLSDIQRDFGLTPQDRTKTLAAIRATMQRRKGGRGVSAGTNRRDSHAKVLRLLGLSATFRMENAVRARAVK